MNTTERAAIVLQEIDAAIAMTVNSRTLLSTSLRCLKTAIEGLLEIGETGGYASHVFRNTLAALCDQWEQMK